MSLGGTLQKKSCKEVRHLFVALYTLIFFAISASCLGMSRTSTSPYAGGRAPASFIPDDEVVEVPFENEIWVNGAFKEDNAGVLKSMKNQFSTWEETEEYVQNWNLQNTGLYTLPTDNEKESYLKRNILKYLDKRLAGEIKDAKDGSTMKSVGQVHKALRPSTKLQVVKNVRIKFKARVLQGRGFLIIDNPYVDFQVRAGLDGEVNATAGKKLKSLGINTNVDYSVTNGRWVASVSKKLTEKITAGLSSTQSDDQMAFTSGTDRKLELRYATNF